MGQSLFLLKARVKLQQRHLQEWYDLIADQQMVWRLVKEETAQKITIVSQDKRACIELRSKQAVRLIKLMERQCEERQQLKRRLQEEMNSLEQVVEKARLNSTEPLPERSTSQPGSSGCPG